MPRITRAVKATLFAIGALGIGWSCQEPPSRDLAPEALKGVVVEEVGEGSALAKAGIEPGDVLLSWQRLPSPPTQEPSAGEFESPFDWYEFKTEQAPRGTAKILGDRGGKPSEWTVIPGLWEDEVRPVLLPAFEEIYSTGRTHLWSGDTESAARVWRSLADRFGKDGRTDLQAWVLLRIGEAWVEQSDREAAPEYFRKVFVRSENPQARIAASQALGEVQESRNELQEAEGSYLATLEIRQTLRPESLGAAESLAHLGKVAYTRGDLDRAHGYLLRGFQIREQHAPESLELAESLNSLGGVAWSRGDLDRAYDLFFRALRIREELAPESLELADSLNNLGSVAWSRGNLDRAYDLFFRALRISEQLAPQSLDVASNLNALGCIAQAQGDLSRAYDYMSQSLRIREKLAPKSLFVATSLNNLGSLAKVRGDMASAYDYMFQSLRIREQIAPQSLDVAISLAHLGDLARSRRELERAYDFHLQALKIRQQLAPQSLAVAESLDNLGSVAWSRGDLESAGDYHFRALRIREKIAPETLAVAMSLSNLGTVVHVRGDFERANHYFHQALRIREQLAPQSLATAESLNNLGVAAQAQGALDSAHEYNRRALQIREELAPRSLDLAQSLYHMGNLSRDFGKLDTAHKFYGLALDALEHQVTKLGGSYTVEADFRSQYSKYYDDMRDLLLTRGNSVEAFLVLERFRAQTFLTMLAERDIHFRFDITEELHRERRQLAASYGRTVQLLAGLNLRDHRDEIENKRRELEKLDYEASDLEARIRLASPRLGALQYPRPLNVEDTQASLDPRTLLLSYGVGTEFTALFTLSRSEDLEVKILPCGEEALRSQVENLLQTVRETWPDSLLGRQRRQRFQAASRELYVTLFEPVEELIASTDRLLILPDGPLHHLPFAALIRGTANGGSGGQYLVEWRPIHVALSATVYAELKVGRRGDRDAPVSPNQVAAFGDPRYPQSLTATEADSEGDSPSDAVVRSAAERGIFDWQPLPYTRQEVEGIASLFADESVQSFLGAEALEERIKSLDPRTRILHIAAHGYIDEHLPSSSFLALTIPKNPGPDQDNGLLQMWEILERVRIDADLVVLSACESGLGKELRGEGLIGLTRAFHYAGARSVVASLWSVADQTTAELMLRFYRHLRSGLPKDEALRAAQLELIRGPIEVTDNRGRRVLKDASAPFYWAAFQVYGDWQ